jgi:hypothetical protein
MKDDVSWPFAEAYAFAVTLAEREHGTALPPRSQQEDDDEPNDDQDDDDQDNDGRDPDPDVRWIQDRVYDIWADCDAAGAVDASFDEVCRRVLGVSEEALMDFISDQDVEIWRKERKGYRNGKWVFEPKDGDIFQLRSFFRLLEICGYLVCLVKREGYDWTKKAGVKKIPREEQERMLAEIRASRADKPVEPPPADVIDVEFGPPTEASAAEPPDEEVTWEN